LAVYRFDTATRQARPHKTPTAAHVKFLANPHINRLAAHSTLHHLAWGISGVFFAVFLLGAGIAPAAIFLSIAGIRVVRFALRPLVLLVIPAIGLRRTMMLGTFLFALQYPALAFVDGPGPALLAFCAITALGEGFYFRCYHALFAALGDAEHRGSQLGVRQGLAAVASLVGRADTGFQPSDGSNLRRAWASSVFEPKGYGGVGFSTGPQSGGQPA
jgi:DHA1 family inner membrane transport protein